jgi:cysteinyl-tRNA synthetase
MNDDLNTPNAYAAIFESIKLLNQQLRVREINFIALNKYIISIEKMLEILGIKINRVILDDEDRALYLGWDLAKKNKDYESADKYRNKLLERGKM